MNEWILCGSSYKTLLDVTNIHAKVGCSPFVVEISVTVDDHTFGLKHLGLRASKGIFIDMERT